MKNDSRILTMASASALLIALTASGCLKTRAQIRDGDAAPGASAGGTPTQVQPVEPQGSYAIDEIKSEITRLTGRLEDLERSKREEPAVDSAKLETRIAELEKAQAEMIEVIKKLESKTPAAEDPQAFETGKSQHESGNFEGAIESFTSYLKSPKAKRAEDATYFRAESYFNTKQYKKAIVDYSKFPERFTKSRRMPAALYKIGLSFEALGMKEDAKGFYQELVDKFPKSSEAKSAKGKLK